MIEKQEVLQGEVNEIREAVKLDKEDLNSVTGRVALLKAKTLDASKHRKQDKECVQEVSSLINKVEIREAQTTNVEYQSSWDTQNVLTMNKV